MSAPSYNLVITNEAKADIQAIAHYTADRWGADQSRSYLSLIYTHIQEIKVNIDVGRSRDGLPVVIKGYKAQKHIIFYRVQKEIIFILRILHERMDHARHI